MAVVVSAQWYYDNHTKRQLLIEVSKAAIAYTNVARSGISNFVEKTREIDYDELFSHSETIIIGFQHNPRVVDEYFTELQSRVTDGKETRILVSDQNGNAVTYLSKSLQDSDHIIPEIRKVIDKTNAINRVEKAKQTLQLRFHDAVLTYSFVYSKDGVWIKAYRNSLGKSSPPGIFVRSASPLFEFYKQDIESLWELASDDSS
ncbi:MAG: hypothetical protein OXP09_01795 [Gammaproteobacteria bacterium]|nr:hypothetical protein [Gammaproteobacteria bacterium]